MSIDAPEIECVGVFGLEYSLPSPVSRRFGADGLSMRENPALSGRSRFTPILLVDTLLGVAEFPRSGVVDPAPAE